MINACSSRKLFSRKLANVLSNRSAWDPVAAVTTACRAMDMMLCSRNHRETLAILQGIPAPFVNRYRVEAIDCQPARQISVTRKSHRPTPKENK